MRSKLPILFSFILALVLLVFFLPSYSLAAGEPSRCTGTPVDFGIEKKFIPIASFPQSGRTGACMTPKYIVIHTTASSLNAEQIYEYFAGGAGGRGVGSQFVIGKGGEAIQMGETLASEVDVVYHTYGHNSYAIGIELTHEDIYADKASAPPAQYQKTLELVRALMKQYNILVNDVNFESGWKAPSDEFTDPPAGTYGHYQLNPSARSDPGEGFLRDLQQDLKSGGGSVPGGPGQLVKSNCIITKVGETGDRKPTLPPGCETPGGVPNADRAALLAKIKQYVDEGKIAFMQSNDLTGMTNGSGQVLRDDGTMIDIDTQVMRFYVYMVDQEFTFSISSMVGHHDKFSSSGKVSRHWDGHAIDVAIINGLAVNNPAAKDATIKFMQTVNGLRGGDLVPSQLLGAGNKYVDPDVDNLSMNGGEIDEGFTTREVGDHIDHVHVGY